MSARIITQSGDGLIFPIFKFQAKDHARKMCDSGNVRLSNMCDFRRGKHGGLIDDPREGRVSLFYATDKVVGNTTLHLRTDISLDNVFIFCGSTDFFSKTLEWAISDKKESCVLITDISEVASRITTAIPGLDLIGASPCTYSGRDIGINGWCTELRDEISANALLAGFVKPKSHALQREFRILWEADPGLANESHIIRDSNIQDFLIPISFDGLHALFGKDQNHCVGAHVVTTHEEYDAHFSMQYPLATCSPVIHKHNNDYMLGFLSPSKVIRGSHCHGGQIALLATRVGAILCSVYLKDVVRIEYKINS